MTKEYKHKDKNITVKVAVRRGQPVVTGNGFIELLKIKEDGESVKLFNGCSTISKQGFYSTFKEVA